MMSRTCARRARRRSVASARVRSGRRSRRSHRPRRQGSRRAAARLSALGQRAVAASSPRRRTPSSPARAVVLTARRRIRAENSAARPRPIAGDVSGCPVRLIRASDYRDHRDPRSATSAVAAVEDTLRSGSISRRRTADRRRAPPGLRSTSLFFLEHLRVEGAAARPGDGAGLSGSRPCSTSRSEHAVVAGAGERGRPPGAYRRGRSCRRRRDKVPAVLDRPAPSPSLDRGGLRSSPMSQAERAAGAAPRRAADRAGLGQPLLAYLRRQRHRHRGS